VIGDPPPGAWDIPLGSGRGTASSYGTFRSLSARIVGGQFTLKIVRQPGRNSISLRAGVAHLVSQI
jgi:hypothetical protein